MKYFKHSLIVITVVSCFSYYIFQLKIDSDDGWIEAFVYLQLLIYIVISIVYFAIFFRKGRTLVKSIFILILIIPIVSNVVGGIIWNSKFDETRLRFENVIVEIEKFKIKKGEYPNKLNLIDQSVFEGLEKYRIDYRESKKVFEVLGKDRIYYKTDKSTFEFAYNYGWYLYTYQSARKRWIKSD